MWQIVLALALIVLISLAYAATQGAPWVPTWKRDLDRIRSLANVKKDEHFIELGCGNARVCRAIKEAHQDAHVTGLELSLLQYTIGWLQNKLSRTPVQMKLANAYRHHLGTYDIVYMFLMPETYTKLRPKFEEELRPGARVISYVWPIDGWEPTAIDESEGSPKIYLYQR